MTTKTNTGTNTSLLPLVLGVVSIIGSIAGTAWGGATWLNGKFAAEDAKITISERQRSQSTEGMQRQIDSLNAALRAMSVSQPRPTRDLVRDLLVTKSVPPSAEYEKSYGASANLPAAKKQDGVGR
jgi:hypothetical protein